MKSIDALPWEYTVVHSRRKTISIEIVSQNSILIKAPYFYSRSAVLDLIEKNRTKISERMERLKKIPPRPLISPEKREEIRSRARFILPPRVEYWSTITGLSYRSLRISVAEKRFGSCNSKAGIALTCYLADLSQELIDYVIVHELCHTVHLNHSKDFYSLLSRFLPDYREREKELGSVILPTVPSVSNESQSKKENSK